MGKLKQRYRAAAELAIDVAQDAIQAAWPGGDVELLSAGEKATVDVEKGVGAYVEVHLYITVEQAKSMRLEGED